MKATYEETHGKLIPDANRPQENQTLEARARVDMFIPPKPRGDEDEDDDGDLTKPVEVPGDE